MAHSTLLTHYLIESYCALFMTFQLQPESKSPPVGAPSYPCIRHRLQGYHHGGNHTFLFHLNYCLRFRTLEIPPIEGVTYFPSPTSFQGVPPWCFGAFFLFLVWSVLSVVWPVFFLLFFPVSDMGRGLC